MAYLNVEEIEAALENLAAAYPARTEVIAVPNRTHEGRQSHVMRIGVQPAATTQGILILGGVHAREWVPPDALISLAADLLEAYELGTGLAYGGQRFTANEIRQVMETMNLFVYPCANPDGRHHSQTNDAMWRKNRRPHPNGGSCIGVDINRNFDFLWDHQIKFAPDSNVSASANPCDRSVYRGPAATSEPETQNVVWLLDTQPTIHWLMDVHSAVPVILHSWGSDQNQTTEPTQTFLNSAFDGIRGRPNDTAYGEYITQEDANLITMLSTRMNDAVRAVRGDNYGVDQAFGLYPTSGASDDYAYSRQFTDPAKAKVYGFCVECGHSFQPVWSEAEEVIREVSAGLIAFCLGVSASDSAGVPGQLLSYGDAGTPGNVSSPVVVGFGGWLDFKFLFAGRNIAGEDRIYAVNQNGELLSYGDAGTPGNVSSPVVVGFGGWLGFKFLFAGRNIAGEDRIYAVNQNGELLSYGDAGTPGNVSSPVVVGFGGWLDFKFLFAGRNIAGEDRIYAVNQNGELLSYGDAGTPGNVSSPVVVGFGGWLDFKFLFAGRNIAGEDRIYAVNQNGELLSYGDAGTPGNVSSPVVVGFGGWLGFKFLFAGRNIAGEDRIYAVVA